MRTTATITGAPRHVAAALHGLPRGLDVLVHLDDFVLAHTRDELLERGITTVPDPRLTDPSLGVLLSTN